ncbi:MAG: integrase [Nitrococcus sp.]|nr:integrase [Nitrococcus sp.]
MANRDLPPRCYLRHGSYYFVTMAGKWHNLGRERRAALLCYADKVTLPQALTLNRYMDRYMAKIAPQKAPRTQKDNAIEIEKLRAYFGHMLPEDVLATDIYSYMDARGAPIRANREIALFSHLYRYLIRWGVVQSNPCREVARNKESPRTRYVTDAEFWAVHDLAPPVVGLVMRLAAITGLRIGTILTLRRDQIADEGLRIPAVKRGKALLILWSADLRAVIGELKRLRDVAGLHLVCRRDGKPYTGNGFQTLWKRVIGQALAQGKLTERFTLHDLRAKAGSETDDDELLGHQDVRVLRRHYQRAPRRVRPNEVKR